MARIMTVIWIVTGIWDFNLDNFAACNILILCRVLTGPAQINQTLLLGSLPIIPLKQVKGIFVDPRNVSSFLDWAQTGPTKP